MSGKKLTYLNQLIQAKVHPDLALANGDGYFYFFSESDEFSLKLSFLESTSVFVAKITHLTHDQWLEEARYILNKTKEV